MRISCPKCDAAYDVPDTALAAGPRRLRCARCGHQFQAALPGAAPARAEPSAAAGNAPAAADLLRAKLAAAPVPPLATPPLATSPLAPAVAGPQAPRLAEKMAADKSPAAAPRPAAEPPPAPALPPIPETRAQGRLRDAPASPPDRFALLGWLLTIAVLAAAGYAAYAFQAEIVAAWPPALRVYALLGLT